jgi:citrate lyase subunit beta/citryl-CoA lyase
VTTAHPALPAPAWLFCPGDRPDRYAKALAAADVVILDLEDAVSAANKEAARTALRTTPLDPERVVVRVNPVDTPFHQDDLAAVRDTDYRTVMLAKTEHAAQLDHLTQWSVVALVETAMGVLHAEQIAAHDATAGLMWGAEDLIASLGGKSSRDADGRYRPVCGTARDTVLLAAGAYGRAAVDAVYLDIADLDGLAAESIAAAATGFTHKACIHPSHVGPIRAGFRPGDEEIDWARRVMDAVSAGGVTTVGGQMVDAPLLRQAEQILRLAGG